MDTRADGEGWEEQPAGSPFAELIGPSRAREEDGVLRYGFVVERRHLNRIGGLSGGMTSAFLDMALSQTVAHAIGQARIATIHLGVDFVDVARAQDFVEVRGEIVRATRSVVFARGTLRCGARVIATADGVWKVLAERPAAAAVPD